MRFQNLAKLAAILTTCVAMPAYSEDLALVISNSDLLSRNVGDQLAKNHDSLVSLYRDKGYTVFSGENLDRGETQTILRRMARALEADKNGRAVVHYSGPAVSVGAQNMILPDNADSADDVDLLFDAIPVQALLSTASIRREGTVILAIGAARANDFARKPARLREIDVDDDILLIHGPMRFVNGNVRDKFLGQGLSASAVSSSTSAITLAGRVNSRATLTDATSSVGGSSAEDVMWGLAEDANSELMFRAYLERFPNGKFAEEARRKLDANPGQLQEDAMELTNADKREIQQKLTILGYDTRGIDGIFGRGTRASISKWQKSARFDTTGYVSERQLRQLDRDAERKAEEIREEERIQREEDNDYWRVTGRSGDERDLRRYLERYPAGQHADNAKAQLGVIEEKALQEANRGDRDAWNRAKARDTINSYQDYLEDFPRGSFVNEAKGRINAKRNVGNEKSLKAAEKALGLNRASVAVLELKLATRGLNVGNVDGKITGQTRKAIARFQGTQGLPATGYLTQATMQRILLSSF